MLEGQPQIRLIADSPAGSASISVSNISPTSIGKLLLLGSFGDSSAEIVRIHTATAPSGSTVTLSANTVKDHYSDSSVTVLDFEKIEFSRATTLTGSKTVLATQSIDEELVSSFYKDLTNSSGYAFARFARQLSVTITSAAGTATVTAAAHNLQTGQSVTIAGADQADYNGTFTITVTTSGAFTYTVPNAPVSPATGTITATSYGSYSTGVSYSGNGSTSLEKIVEKACNDAVVEVGGQYSSENMLLNDANDCQQAITKHDWKFELVRDSTALTATSYENTYDLSSLTYALKYPGITQGIKSVKFGNARLEKVDNDVMDGLYKSVKRTAVATEAAIAATSIVLDNTSELSEESGTVYINGMTLAYTGNDKSTNTLSGISAAAITAIIPVDSIVWQNLNPGLPTKYTVNINNQLVLDRPVLSDYDNYSIEMEYLKTLTAFTDFASTTEVPFPDIFPLYIAAKIEKRKRNMENYREMMGDFEKDLQSNFDIYKMPVLDNEKYYYFFDSPISTV